MKRTERALYIFLLVVLAGCAARQPGDPLEPGFNVYSPEDDIEIGRQAAREIEQQLDLVDDPELQDYISDIGQSLAAQPRAGDFPYSFTAVNDDSINAFALPGGPIYVNSGLIEKAQNEAQLAGVLAHEIAHVALRHGTSQASKATLAQIPAVLAGAVIGQGSTLAELGQLGIGFGLNSLLLKYSRTAEQEADALGARIMAETGHNPVEMARFFEILEEERGGVSAPQFLSSHPDPGNRRESVQAEIATFEARDFDAATGRFAEAQRAAARLPEPEKRIAANPGEPPDPPPGEFETFESSHYSIEYPSAWDVYGSPGDVTVTIAPEQGLVESQRGILLAYGAAVSQVPADVDVESGTRQLISELQAVSRGLETVGPSRRIVVNGSEGRMTELAGPSPYGGTERDVLLTVERPEGLFYLVFVAPEQDFVQLEPVLNQMLQSITF